MVHDKEEPPVPEEEKKESILLGLGFDNSDGQKRITEGDNFLLAGGSERTHDFMVEKVLKFNDILKNRYGKKLEDITQEEYYQIVSTLGEEKIHWQYWNDFYKNHMLLNKKKKRF